MLRFKRLAQLSVVGSAAAELHRDWIAAREQRLARRGRARVCSFRWGMEALADLPGFESLPGSSELDSFQNANQRLLQNREEFFAYQTPRDFKLSGSHLQFSSAIRSLCQENDTVYAEYFHCNRASRRAVLVLPHWIAAPDSYTNFCRLLNFHRFSALLVTLPYHGNGSLASASARNTPYRLILAGRLLLHARASSIRFVVWIGWEKRATTNSAS